MIYEAGSSIGWCLKGAIMDDRIIIIFTFLLLLFPYRISIMNFAMPNRVAPLNHTRMKNNQGPNYHGNNLRLNSNPPLFDGVPLPQSFIKFWSDSESQPLTLLITSLPKRRTSGALLQGALQLPRWTLRAVSPPSVVVLRTLSKKTFKSGRLVTSM
jgi:hypothetical protein